MKKTKNSKALTLQDPQHKAEKVFDLLDVSEATRTDYKYRIGLFLDFTAERGFSRNSCLEYKRALGERTDYSVSTKNKYLITAKIFLKELNRQGILPADITLNVKTFSQSKKHKRDGLNEQEMGTLSEMMRSMPITPQNVRLKALFGLLALQGLRQCEIMRLDVSDLDLVARTALVRGKGQDDKEVINLHPEAVRALQSYLKLNKLASGALFVSRSNNSRGARLTTRALRGMVKETLNALGIEKTTHGFRHYFATRLIKAYGGDLLEVARLTRHRSIETLQVYNDNIKLKADLPRYYSTFEEVKF